MIIFFVILIGLVLGSFFNALIFRIGHNQSIARGRSKCPQCQQQIAWYDLVPVLSFVWLRGKCRNCHAPISWRYPLVEVGTAAALVWLYLVFGLSLHFYGGVLAIVFLIPIFLTDLQYQIIPDRIVVPGIVIIGVAQILLGTSVANVFTAAMVGAGFFLWQYVLSRGRWIGAGDIGLGALMGAVLGWPVIVVALALAYLGGAIIGIAIMVCKKSQSSTQLPFAPFLTTATFMCLLYGSTTLRLVRQLTGW